MPARPGVNLGAVTADPDRYHEQRIMVAACINVLIHGVALLPCGQRLPNVEILESQAVGGRAFERLLSYAHEHMGDSPD